MLVSLTQRSPIAVRARAMRELSESHAPVPLDYASRELVNERLGDVVRGGVRAVGRAARGLLKRAQELKRRAAKKARDLFQRKKPEKPTTKAPEARPKPSSMRVGIPKKQPKDAPADRERQPVQKHPGGVPSKAELKQQQRYDAQGNPIPGPPGEVYPTPWPANLDTTSKGPPVKPKSGVPPEAKLRRLGPKGRPGKYKPAVSHAAMYKHMVRAIYQRGKKTGYAFQHSPAKSSQMIARAKMVQWKYAKRRKSKGGTPDRRMIELTGKGRARDWGQHLKEPYAVRVAKDRDYYAITGRDPY